MSDGDRGEEATTPAAEPGGETRFRLLDATGNEVEVTHEEAQRGLADGSLRAGRPLAALDPRGTAGTLAPDRIADALRRGYRLDTPAAAARRAYQREHPIETEVVNPTVTAASGVLREGSLGASELGEEALGVREELNRLREENPTAATVGDIGGVALPALLTGGASLEAEGGSLASRIARGAMAPGRLALTAGERAGAGVARSLAPEGASIARRILARAAGGAAEGALQTGLSEGGHILTEEALGDDPGDIADRMISSVGLGALFGGGLGAAGGTVTEALRGGRSAASGVAEALQHQYVTRTGRALDGGVADMLADQYARVAGALGGQEAGTVRRFVGLGAEGRAARRVVERGDEVYEAGTRRVVSALDRVGRAMHHVTGDIVGGMKVSSIERVVDASNLAEQLGESATLIGRARSLADQIDREMRAYGGASQFGQRGGAAHSTIRGAVERAEAELERIARSTDSEARRAAETFAAMDELRRQMGRAQVAVGRGTTGPVHDAYYELRALLERDDVWGDGAAALQRETNEPWHRFLTTAGDFDRAFMREGAAMGFDRLTTGDSARVSSYVRALGSAANESREAVMRDTLAALGDLNEAALAHHALSVEGRAQAVELRRALRDLADTHGEVLRDASILNQWRELGGGSTSLGDVMRGAATVGAVVGGLPLGAAMGAVGMAANALTRPQMVAMRIGAIQRALSSVDARIATQVRSFVRRGARTVRAATERASAVGSRTIRGGAYGGIAAYRRRVERLTHHQDGTALTAAIAESTRDMGDTPRLRQAAQTTAARAHAYLLERLPRSPVPPGLRGEPGEPSRIDRERFMRIARAVDDPLSTLADLRDGSITPETVDALRTVYPGLYRRICDQVTREITESRAPLSYQDRIRLSMLLGVPTDPSLRPESIAVLQDVYAAAAAAEAQQPARRTAPDVGSRYASRTDAIEGRRSA